MLADAYIPGAWAQDADGETGLHLAIRARNLESVRVLTIKSRDKAQHMQNRENKFPLNLATTRTYREVICGKGGDQKGDMFTRRLIGVLAWVWFTASVVSLVAAVNRQKMWIVQIEGSFLGSWLFISLLSTTTIGSAIEEAGWIGRLVMCIIPILKSLESFLIIVPLAILTAYRGLWVDEGQEVLLSDQVVLASAVVVCSANAIMEDGSRFHALELSPSASYSEIAVLFIYRLSEYLSRIAVFCLGLVDLLHCHRDGDPTSPCPYRGCLMSNPECTANCSCAYKGEIFVVLIVEFLLLLIFLRVTATQDNAQSTNAIENLQHHIKIWACSLCNMQSIYFTPPKTMVTYLGLKQADTAYLGEVKLLDGVVLLGLRFIANVSLLLVIIQVEPPTEYASPDYFDEQGTQILVLCGIAGAPLQVLVAYVRYLIWDKIEKRVEMRFKLMSKREQIASSRGTDAATDQVLQL